MSTKRLERRIEVLEERTADDGPDEETAIALARAAALAEGRRIRPTTGEPTTGDPHGLIISMIVVDMRSDQTEVQNE